MRMSDKTADVLKHAAQTKRDRSPVEADKLRAAAIMNHVMPELERRLLQNLCIATENAPAIDDKTRQALYGDFSLAHGGDFSLGFADVQSVLKSRAASKLPRPGRISSVTVSVHSSLISFRAALTPSSLAANDHVLREAGTCIAAPLSAPVQDGLIRAGDVPAHIAEKALSAMAAALVKSLTGEHGLSQTDAAEIVENARQRAALSLCADMTRGPAIAQFARNMDREDRLTSAFIARAAGCGHMRLTQYALARRAAITPAKAALMLYAPGNMGLTALAQRAGIGGLDIHILRVAAGIFREFETAGLDYDTDFFRRRVMDSLLHAEPAFSDADGDYLLEKLDGLGAQEFH